LSLLARAGRLHSWTNSIFLPNDRFRADLFWRVLSSIETIGCQNGRSIDVRGLIPSAAESPVSLRSCSMPCPKI
jgi:hypothetical protein